MDVKKSTKKYRTQSTHYFENALKSIDARELEKASEFLWGSMAQALKALAASKERTLKSHNDIRNYAMDVSRALKDDSIRHAFDKAQSLHSNFYESGLTIEDVLTGAEDVKKAVAKLLEFVPDHKSS